MSSYYLLKHKNRSLEALSLVKLEAITYSGNCYLVSDFNNNREWVMYYDLYKTIDKNDNNQIWFYNEKYDRIMKELISKL